MSLELIALATCLALFGLSAVQLKRNRHSLADDSELTLSAPPPAAAPGRLLRLSNALPGQPSGVVLSTLILAPALAVASIVLLLSPDTPHLVAVVLVGLPCIMLLGLRELASWRARRFDDQLISTLELMNAALQGGLNTHAALRAAAQSREKAIREEFREIVVRLDLGFPIERAIERLHSRYDCESVRLLCQALRIKWRDGGDFSALLNAISGLLNQRVTLRRQVEAQLAGARYAALFAGALPYLLIPVFVWRQPQWLDVLKAHPQGSSLIVAAVLAQIAGLIWLRRIQRVQL